MRRKALEGEGGEERGEGGSTYLLIYLLYLAAEGGAVCCMVTASADKTQQAARGTNARPGFAVS
jgi:hypothetical protein